jgi:hypothetical protein
VPTPLLLPPLLPLLLPLLLLLLLLLLLRSCPSPSAAAAVPTPLLAASLPANPPTWA